MVDDEYLHETLTCGVSAWSRQRITTASRMGFNSRIRLWLCPKPGPVSIEFQEDTVRHCLLHDVGFCAIWRGRCVLWPELIIRIARLGVVLSSGVNFFFEFDSRLRGHWRKWRKSYNACFWMLHLNGLYESYVGTSAFELNHATMFDAYYSVWRVCRRDKHDKFWKVLIIKTRCNCECFARSDFSVL